MKKLGLFLTITSLVIMSLSAVVFNQAYAQTPTPNPTDGFGPRSGWGHGKPGGFQGVLHDYSVKALAEALGITAEDLQTRLTAGEKMFDIAKSKGWTLQDFQSKMPDIMSKALDLAVADGKITKEQADLMRQRQQDWSKGGNKMGAGDGVMSDYITKALAEAIGMKVEDIQARLKAGEKMLDIAKSKGWTLQDFQTKMPDIMSKALDLAVADGKITKEQADLMRQRQQNRSNGDWGKRGKQGSMLGGTGPMHDFMEQAMAQVLGITPEDLSKRLSGGEKPAKIAQDKGINLQDFRTKLADAATQLINQAVKDSKLTQTQADWFLQMIQRMQGKFDGSGRCPNGHCGSETPVPVLTPNL